MHIEETNRYQHKIISKGSSRSRSKITQSLLKDLRFKARNTVRRDTKFSGNLLLCIPLLQVALRGSAQSLEHKIASYKF